MEAEIKGRNELSRIIYPAVQIPGDAWMKLQAEDQKRSDDLNRRTAESVERQATRR